MSKMLGTNLDVDLFTCMKYYDPSLSTNQVLRENHYDAFEPQSIYLA